MKRATFALAMVLIAVPAWAQQWRPPGDRWNRVPYIGGTWYMNGEWNNPCAIIQERPDGNAQFVNEHGSRAWGTVRGGRVWIPDWQDGFQRQGLRGVIRGDRIVWPDGSFWSR